EAAEVRAARRRVEDELARAGKQPARETAGALAAALRAYARTLADGGAAERAAHDLLARLETESFAPDAAASPLSAELRARVDELARSWSRRKPAARGHVTAASALVLVMLGATAARADVAPDRTNLAPATADHAGALDAGRTAYQQA